MEQNDVSRPEKQMVEHLIGDLPESLQLGVKELLEPYSTTLIRLRRNVAPEDTATQIGSGTLVRIGEIYGILTANHVSRELAKEDHLALILEGKEHQFDIPPKLLDIFPIGEGSVESEGPDLSFIRIFEPKLGTIKMHKSFYPLLHDRSYLLETPPNLKDGVWYTSGTIAELTKVEQLPDGNQVTTFGGYVFATGIEKAFERYDFDYYDASVMYGGRSYLPNRFQGMSGGGLWQIPITEMPDGELKIGNHFLSGVIFYATEREGDHQQIRCHGRKSVVEVAINRIEAKYKK